MDSAIGASTAMILNMVLSNAVWGTITHDESGQPTWNRAPSRLRQTRTQGSAKELSRWALCACLRPSFPPTCPNDASAAPAATESPHLDLDVPHLVAHFLIWVCRRC